MSLDREKLRNLQWLIMQNVSACSILPLMRISDELKLFAMLAEIGLCSVEKFAESAGIDARYGREWIHAMCAAGYCSYDEEFENFHLSEEQKATFADEESPALMIGAYDLLTGNVHNIDKVMEAFKTGGGVNYDKFHPCIFKGTARFFKPSYKSNLIQKWMPKIPEAEKILIEGGSLCDVGCGKGLAITLLASEYTKAKFFGFDIHVPSIEEAKIEAQSAKLDDRLNYEVASANDYHGEYDIITFFDSLHDMGDPLSAASYAKSKLSSKGMVILIEPSASDEVSENMNTIGQMYYSFSTMGCIPVSKSQEVGLALGAQAGAKTLMEIMNEAGFRDCDVVTKNATNMIIVCKQ